MTTHQHSKFFSKSKTRKKAVVLKCWILHLGYCTWTSKSFKRTWGHQNPQFPMTFQCHVDLPVMDPDFYQLFNTKTEEIHDDLKSDTTILLAGLSDISHIQVNEHIIYHINDFSLMLDQYSWKFFPISNLNGLTLLSFTQDRSQNYITNPLEYGTSRKRTHRHPSIQNKYTPEI